MIINIPINIDEEQFNKVVINDYERKVQDEVLRRIEKALCERSGYYDRRPSGGIIAIVEDLIDGIIKEHKDEIIEKASDKLAERLSRTKKAKEILNEQTD